MRRHVDRRGFPLVTIGFVWFQESRGVWKRHVLRRFESSGKIEVTEVVHVEQNAALTVMFCFRCFSQHLHEIEHREWKWYHCQACNFEFRIE